MACGRPKNLENAGRNLLCGCRDRRRNFFTTGNGNRRRGNPEPLAEGETPSYPAKGNFGPLARSSPALSAKRKLCAIGTGETPDHPAMGSSGATGHGGARRHPARGKPRAGPAQGKTSKFMAAGKPGACAAKKALGHPGEGKT